MYDYYYFVAHSALGTLPHMYVLIVSCMYDFISRARDLLMGCFTVFAHIRIFVFDPM